MDFVEKSKGNDLNIVAVNIINQKKEKQGLEKAKADGLITEEEFLRISAQRAAETLDKFLEKKGRPKHQSARKS